MDETVIGAAPARWTAAELLDTAARRGVDGGPGSGGGARRTQGARGEVRRAAGGRTSAVVDAEAAGRA